MSELTTVKEHIKKDEMKRNDIHEQEYHTHFGQPSLSINEFARQHSDYLEKLQRESKEKYDWGIIYEEMRNIIWDNFCDYFECFKYDNEGYLKWKSRRNKEYENTPYPITRATEQQLKDVNWKDNPFSN